MQTGSKFLDQVMPTRPVLLHQTKSADMPAANAQTASTPTKTDPHFTNRAEFLGSDYMMARLVMDPQITHMRLGDGFYETQLVNDQIHQLTGRKYPQGYTNAFDEFMALMDSGIASAKAFGLEPGLALSDAQIAALTSDIVWMVQQSGTLPGSRT